ncbi:MAG: hypothetical protein KF795_07155 [Labilithrix sp.]|nr:hypothetical protein [Labilithrix sp.]
MVVATTLAACSSAPEEEVGGDRASVKQAEFDKNSVLTDVALRDTKAMSAADIQAFLDKTPWGHASVLATYEENGKSAAEIMHDASEKHGINPLELLVRAQMEQSLIYKKNASAESISIAFGCGCPHSPVCSSKYEGFANQAECAAGTLSRSMDRALTSNGTASGWKMGEEKLTQDKVEIVPANAATAALYTYTPWVGEAGGGRKGVGGASLHYQVWGRFADATGYGVVGNDVPGEGQGDVLEAEQPDPADEDPNNGGNDGNQGGEDDEEPAADPAPAPNADAGAPQADPEPDPHGDEAPKGDSTADDKAGADDDDILGEGNAPPATNAPPPRASGSRSKGSSNADRDLTEATDEELAGKKKATGGCSSTGGSTSDASLVGLVMFAASLVAKRRRRQA